MGNLTKDNVVVFLKWLEKERKKGTDTPQKIVNKIAVLGSFSQLEKTKMEILVGLKEK